MRKYFWRRFIYMVTTQLYSPVPLELHYPHLHFNYLSDIRFSVTDCRHWRSHRVTSALIGRNSKIPLLRDIVDFTPATDIDSVTLLFRSQSLAQVWREGKTEQSSLRFTVKSSKNEDSVCNFGRCGRHKGFWLTSQQTIVYREQTKTQLKNYGPNQNWKYPNEGKRASYYVSNKNSWTWDVFFRRVKIRAFDTKIVIFESVTQAASKGKNPRVPESSWTYDPVVTEPVALPLSYKRLGGDKATKLK